MPNVLFLMTIFEIIGLLGFTYISAALSNQGVQYLPLALAAFSVIWLAIKKGKQLTSRQIVIASLCVPLLFIGCFQILGLLLPGMSKDVDIFSVENLMRLSVIAVIAVVDHAGLFVTARILGQRKIK